MSLSSLSSADLQKLIGLIKDKESLQAKLANVAFHFGLQSSIVLGEKGDDLIQARQDSLQGGRRGVKFLQPRIEDRL